MLAFIAFEERFVSFFNLPDEFIFIGLADLGTAHLAFRSKFVQTCFKDFLMLGLELFRREIWLVRSTQLRGRRVVYGICTCT